MTTGNGASESRILTLDQVGRNAKDEQGRLYRHNCTVMEAHQIAVEEAQKVHEWYARQIPEFVARMVTDALIGYGLIKVPEVQAPVAEPAKEHDQASS